MQIPLQMGHHRPLAKRHLNAAFSAFSGNPDQYCSETLYFVVFQKGSGPPAPPPLGPLIIIDLPRHCLLDYV